MAAAEELQAYHVIPADLLLIFVVVLDLAVTVACLGGLSKRAVLFRYVCVYQLFMFYCCSCRTVSKHTTTHTDREWHKIA